jgi:O-antigen/teichoic acid export membrane protein
LRWRAILRNIFSNWAGYVVTAVIGFLLSPFIVHTLGTTGYGLWTLVLSLTGYFGLLDLGIRSSVGRFLARYIALKQDEQASRTLSTAFVILTAGGILALLATVVMVAFFFDSLHVSPRFYSAAKTALVITGLNMSCVLPLGVFSSLLVALERYDILSAVTIAGEVIRATLIVIFLRLGHGLPAIAGIAFVVSFGVYSAMAFFAMRLYPTVRLDRKFIDPHTLKELFGFGIYRFIWMIANQLIFYSDSVVIGIFLSAGAITYYAIAGSLINYGRTVVALVTDTFYPAATRMDARQDMAGLRELLVVATRITLLLALPLCLGFVFLGKQFITLWMGKEYSVSWIYLVVLTIPQFTGMAQYVSALVLAGMARHKLLAYLMLAEGVANLALSIALVRRMGLVGVAWGTAIPDVICSAVIIPWYTLKTVKLDAGEYLRQAFLPPILAVLPALGISYAFSVAVQTPSWRLFGSEVAAICGVVAVTGYFLCLNSEHREMAHDRVRRLFHRESAVHEARIGDA